MYGKIEELMRRDGLSPYRLSKDTGIPLSTIYSWRSGKSEPKMDRLIILSEYFHIPFSYFAEAHETD